MDSFAFVITSKITNITHRNLLLECIRHIRIIYPEHTIYLINDNSNPSLFPLDELIDYNIELVDSLVKNAGEVNPYLFILDERCKNDKLLYIHDSVMIKNDISDFLTFGHKSVTIDELWLNSEQHFIPIWYSNKYIWDDIFIHQNMDILKSMIFYCSNNISLHDLLLNFKKSGYNFLVTFGAMGYFDKQFVEFIRDNTNLFSIVTKFNSRFNRCLFERIISCVYILMYKNIYTKSICGNINSHPASFKNSELYIKDYNNYFLKVWQGR
jgi:hypothetical protein